MANKQLTLPGTIVKKANKLIRSKISLKSVQANRILASFYACIRPNDVDFKDLYSIHVNDVLPSEITGGNDYKYFKNICSELAKATVELEFQAQFTNDKYFFSIPIFGRVAFHKGIITASFNHDLAFKECLIQIKTKFTEINYLEYRRLPSIYSQVLFENLKSWEKTHKEITIDIAELHRILNTPESFQKKFRAFRLFVLEKAHKDINSKTDMNYAWEPIKRGKAFVAIRFILGGKRLAIAEQKAKETAQAKKSAKINKSFVAAMKCATAKGGTCGTEDNKPTICAMCKQQSLQAEARRVLSLDGSAPLAAGSSRAAPRRR